MSNFQSPKIDNKIENSEPLIEDVNYHKTHVKKIGEVSLPDPEHGDLKLSVFPFENTGEWVTLPEGFKCWEEAFNDVLKSIPLQEGANTHYVTIDSKFFTTDDFLRREGVHMDGNFCVDPYFSGLDEKKREWGGASWGGASWGGASYDNDGQSKSSWGGASYEKEKSSWGGASFDNKSSWGGASYTEEETEAEKKQKRIDKKLKELLKTKKGKVDERQYHLFETKSDNSHVKMDWVLPYNIVIPIAQYVSEKKGGILTVSTEIGCQAWSGEFYGEVLSEGAFTEMEDQLTDDKKVVFEKNGLYFMSSNTPHETLLINKGKRRTFLRITLNHNYNNEAILNK